MKIKDRIWLWGQDVMSHHQVGPRKENIWNLPGINRMNPAEGARFLGIRNMCRVVMNGSPKPPFDSEMEKLADKSSGPFWATAVPTVPEMCRMIWRSCSDFQSIIRN